MFRLLWPKAAHTCEIKIEIELYGLCSREINYFISLVNQCQSEFLRGS